MEALGYNFLQLIKIVKWGGAPFLRQLQRNSKFESWSKRFTILPPNYFSLLYRLS